MHIPEVKILRKKSYLAMIRNSAKGENHMFRNDYALVDGQEQDINANGALACSFFASAILYTNKLIKDMHAGTMGLEKDLKASGWVQIDELREGALVVWEPQQGRFVPGMGHEHGHLGFYIGNNRAVSNGSNSTLMPEEHDATYDGTRKIERIWWHPVLD
jgi:hypothetical protein